MPSASLTCSGFFTQQMLSVHYFSAVSCDALHAEEALMPDGGENAQ